MKVTGGKVQTRFPPEPTGFLHIGQAKAMFVDFGLAKERGGGFYLRSRMDVKCWWDWITLISGIDKDIIYEDYDEHVQVLIEHSVHQVYESCWGIGSDGTSWVSYYAELTVSGNSEI
ncbi:hypothetical protein CQW23_06106 [Capsicum baccatum]|uniref:Glutamyl/glutaminyl-tRNA synthetase class Ib catalytic domain-containing protein n=1 Tax=Capsicum baccatum TaxID=33114 RepID=A0A2G2X2C1_CAPBA|nr:hypothetical protein CQW23_06106 [Capsicum baccatum]